LKNTACRQQNMGVGYKIFARPLIALQDSEKAHSRSLLALRFVSWSFIGRMLLRILYKPKNIPVSKFGLNFPNPLGLAAGMDKRAEAMKGWENIGFGFIEIGGITEFKQPGNPKPRMFRDGKTQSLINRMGFNNIGSKEMATHLKQSYSPNVPLFLNVGKSKDTKLEDAHLDYAKTVESCLPYVDGFVINVSSPNTPNLRELQKDEDLARIIIEVQKHCEDKPVLVKISPDLGDMQIKSIVDTARGLGCAGIVATNTTVSRPQDGSIMDETGGLSGRPLKNRSTEVIRLIADHTDGNWPIIGVGGISNCDDAYEKISNGAHLIQLYSSLVFEGPSVVKSIVNGLENRMKSNGIYEFSELIGHDRR